MNYTIKYIEHEGVVEDMVFLFEGEYHILSEFLDDVDSFSQDYLEIFDNVLSGKAEKDSASGNACSFVVDKDKTVIEFLYPENEDKPEICSVKTKELRALMDEWLQKHAEFLNKKK